MRRRFVSKRSFDGLAMQKEVNNALRLVFPYVSSALAAALAAALWLDGNAPYAVLALLAAVSGCVSAHRLQKQVTRADEQRCYLDQQLIQSQKLAAIGELSSGIAHEINNPLAIIGQENEWIKRLLKGDRLQDPEVMEELRESLGEIARQVDRCKEITHKLLDFARKKEPLIQMTDVNKLIEDMARLVEKEASRKQIRILRNYDKDLPRVQTDPPLLRQVVLNLLNNATYAIGQNGEITITTERSNNDWVQLVFSDTGCGIPKEQLDKIFDPFFTTKPPGKGTGLGLSISHGIIGKLGGSIDVKSEVGKGATFTIRLPSGKS